MTLLLAGHETTAMAITWALAAIDRAPAVRAELEAEWDAQVEGTQDVPAGTSADHPAAALLSATLPLSTAVLAEALRLWPPSWMFSRRVTEPLTLGGCTMPTGTMCLISPALLHRDQRWWAEPDQRHPRLAPTSLARRDLGISPKRERERVIIRDNEPAKAARLAAQACREQASKIIRRRTARPRHCS